MTMLVELRSQFVVFAPWYADAIYAHAEIGLPTNRHREVGAISLYFVEAVAFVRVDVRRVARSIGWHCEPYADWPELAAHPKRYVIIIIRDGAAFGGVPDELGRSLNLGIWLQAAAVDCEPSPSRVVRAVKHGQLIISCSR